MHMNKLNNYSDVKLSLNVSNCTTNNKENINSIIYLKVQCALLFKVVCTYMLHLLNV